MAGGLHYMLVLLLLVFGAPREILAEDVAAPRCTRHSDCEAGDCVMIFRTDGEDIVEFWDNETCLDESDGNMCVCDDALCSRQSDCETGTCVRVGGDGNAVPVAGSDTCTPSDACFCSTQSPTPEPTPTPTPTPAPTPTPTPAPTPTPTPGTDGSADSGTDNNTNNTGSAAPGTVILSGDATLTVDNPEQFVADPQAAEAVQEMIAVKTNVTKEWVDVRLELVSRRLQETARRLQGQVIAYFDIEIPESSVSETLSTAEAALTRVTPEELTQTLVEKLSEKGRTYTVEVQSVSEIVTQTVTMPPSPTPSPAPSPAPSPGPAPEDTGMTFGKASRMQGAVVASMACVWFALELAM